MTFALANQIKDLQRQVLDLQREITELKIKYAALAPHARPVLSLPKKQA